jgi:hypothetical protein
MEARIIVLRVSDAEGLLPNEAAPDDLLRPHASQAVPERVLNYSAAPAAQSPGVALLI